MNEIRKGVRWFKDRISQSQGYQRYCSVYRRFRNYTMMNKDWYVANLHLSERFAHVPGSIVECGTWKGGMIAGIATCLGQDRDYRLFDSYEGLPPAKAIDGKRALEWQKDTTSDEYYDNCTASLEDAENAMKMALVPSAKIVKGWFCDPLPDQKFPDGISILRMDADWFDSTWDILSNLFSKVNPSGLIIIDDYYTWEGCTKAIHKFLAEEDRPEKIDKYRPIFYMEKIEV